MVQIMENKMSLVTQFDDRNFSVTSVIQFLDVNPNLPKPQREIAESIRVVAIEMLTDIPDSPELTAGLRKLLEAKDCFVRASLDLGGS